MSSPTPWRRTSPTRCRRPSRPKPPRSTTTTSERYAYTNERHLPQPNCLWSLSQAIGCRLCKLSVRRGPEPRTETCTTVLAFPALGPTERDPVPNAPRVGSGHATPIREPKFSGCLQSSPLERALFRAAWSNRAAAQDRLETINSKERFNTTHFLGPRRECA